MSISSNGADSLKAKRNYAARVTNRIFTIPNLLSFLRLIGVPVFLTLVLQGKDLAAIIFLVAASITDFIDGQIARRFNQMSKLGQVLDPAADRLYILAIAIGLTVRGIVPLALLILIIARDLMLAMLIPTLHRRGYSSLPVHFVGKTATFFLLTALPLVLVGAGDWVISEICFITGWGFAVWGTFLYWWAGVLYVMQTFKLVRNEAFS